VSASDSNSVSNARRRLSGNPRTTGIARHIFLLLPSFYFTGLLIYMTGSIAAAAVQDSTSASRTGLDLLRCTHDTLFRNSKIIIIRHLQSD
jgi:hypothetical protein